MLFGYHSHTKTSCKILHELNLTQLLQVGSCTHLATLQNLARLMQDHQDSCIMEKNLAVSASSKIMMQDLLQELEVFDMYYSSLSA